MRGEKNLAVYDAETCDEIIDSTGSCFVGADRFFVDFWSGRSFPDWAHSRAPAGSVLCPWLRIIGRHSEAKTK